MEKPKHCLRCSRSKLRLIGRGLCWRCYYTPGVKCQYEMIGKAGYRSESGQQGTKLPCKPTTARRGTEEKIQVLAERAANNEELFHELDP